MTNPVIDVDGDTATGQWHVLVTGTLPDREAVWILGVYKDEYRRTAEGWKFKTLRFVAAANAPYGSGWGKQQFMPAPGGSSPTGRYEDILNR